jgi:hypothetical protein
MPVEYLTQLFSLFLFAVVSYGIGRICFYFLKIKLPPFAMGGAVTLTGFGLLALQLTFYSLVGLKFNGYLLYVPWMALGIFTLWRTWVNGQIRSFKLNPLACVQRWLELSLFDKLFSLFFLFVLVNLLLYQTSLPLDGWDTIAIWFLKAKHFYVFGGIDFSMVEIYAHKDYPVTYPLIVDAFYLMGVGLNDQLAQGINYIFLLSTCALYYGFFRGRLPLWAVLGLPIFLLMMPTVRSMNIFTYYVGYADFKQGVVVLFFAVAFSFWVESARPSELAVSLLALALTASIKNEGITFALLGGLAIVFVLLLRFRQIPTLLKTPAIWVAAPLLVIAVSGWGLYTKLNNFETDISGGFKVDRFFDLLPKRWDTITQMIGDELRSDIKYLALGVLLLLALASLLVIRNRLSLAQALLTMVLVGQIATYLIIYVVSPAEPDWQISTTLFRLLTQLLPLTIFVIGLGLANYNQLLGEKDRRSASEAELLTT